jgi:outer membrane protein, heavy metal efflux system
LQGGFVQRLVRVLKFWLFLTVFFAAEGLAQTTLTWQDVQDKFHAANRILQAGEIGVDESRASEVTAFLRPNPTLSILNDQINPFNGGPPHGPFADLLSTGAVSYLYEREQKRNLRLESAQDATKIAVSSQSDLERTLIFNLRMAFIQTLQGKAVRDLAIENLAYYDQVLNLSQERFKAGDIAQIDLSRLQLQRVQYESDVQTAEVSLRTAKIQLLALLNDQTPVEQFDVTGPYEFSAQLPTLAQVRQTALDNRPDLAAAIESVTKAQTDHRLAVANGSADPTFSFDVGRNPPIDQYFGVGVSVPLRIFDRNQGEKTRTQLDINRNRKLMEATRTQVFSDVDSAWAALNSNVILLQPYKDHYLKQATQVRDDILFSYQHGAASLLDFLNAQADYRSVQLNYKNLIGSYLQAAGQLNLAVGREVIQ